MAQNPMMERKKIILIGKHTLMTKSTESLSFGKYATENPKALWENNVEGAKIPKLARKIRSIPEKGDIRNPLILFSLQSNHDLFVLHILVLIILGIIFRQSLLDLCSGLVTTIDLLDRVLT